MANMQNLLSQRFEAQRQKLVSMDIVAVAESLGMTLKPGSSGTYYWEEHDSFHIYPNTNTFRWWSRSIGTNTIDLVQVVQKEMTGHKPSFREAAAFLETGHFDNVTVQPIVKEPFEYYLERYEHPDFNIGRQYLKEERGLSDETIDTFLAAGNMATATRKKGDYFEPVIVFKSRDNDGKMIGASLQGIVENRVQHPERGRLKQMMKNSDGSAGFSLDIGTPKRLVFAEAPIDLMSYYELHKDELQDVKLVAMDGLKKSVISRYVADMLTDGKYSQTMSIEQIRGALDALNKTTNILQEQPDMITLAVDNDEAGQNFVKGLQEEGIPVVSDVPPCKDNQNKMDWNDYLKQMKKENTIMPDNYWDNITFSIERKEPSYTNQLIQEEKLAEYPYLVRLTGESRSINGQLFRQGETVRYEEFVTALYHTRQDYQSGDEENVIFDVLAPNGNPIVRNFHYHLSTNSKPVSELIHHEGLQAYEQATVNLLETMTDTQKEHLREFFKTRVSDVKTDYIYLPNGQEDLGYYLDGYLFAHHYAELDMLSPSKQVDALMERVSEHDQNFLEEHFGYQPDTPIVDYRQSEKNSDRIAEKEEQDFRNQFDRQSFAETIGLMQKYSPEEVLNESNSYHDDVRYQSLLIDLGKVDTNSLYRFIERYINRDIDREALSHFSTQDFITIAKEHELLNETPSVEPWKAITVTQPVNSYTVSTDKRSKEFDNISDLHQFVNANLKRSQRQELTSLLSEPDRGTPLDILMAIDSVAGGDFNVEVNGQSILDLFPDGINEEATEIYRRSSAEIEGTTMGLSTVENGEEVETPEIEKRSLSELQESLSIEGDLVATIASDNSVLYTNTVNFDQDYGLTLEVHSPEEVEHLADITAPWALEVIKDNHSLGYLAYGGDWGNEFDIESELTNLDNWVATNQVENHLYSQEEVNNFLAPLTAEKEAVGELKSYGTFIIDDDFLERRYGSVEHNNSITTPTEQPSSQVEEDFVADSKQEELTPKSVSYEDYKQETEALEKSLKQKISAGELSINVDDEVYAYMIFNGLGNSHPMQTLTEKRLDTLYSTDILEQLKAVTDENVDAYKTKGTPEQDRLYQSLKANQRQLGLADVSSRFVGEMAISAYNANYRLSGLSQEEHFRNAESLFAGMVKNVIEYPCIENGNDIPVFWIHSDNALYRYLDQLSGDVTLTREDLDKLIDTISYHSPEIVWEDNKKSLEEIQEVVSSDSMKKTLGQSQESNTGGELFNRSSSSLGDDSPGTAPKPVEYETQPNFPTNVPLHFNIDRNIKSNYRLHQGYSYPKNRDIRNMNAYAEGIQKSANWYLNELANSTVTYFYVDGEEPKALQMEFKKRHWMHLTGLSPIYLDRLDSVSETFIDEIASGKTTFSNVSVGTGFLDKIQVLPMLPEILETDSFVFDDLSSIEKFGRLDASAAIRSDDKNMVLAFQVDDKNEMFPASLMKPGKKLNLAMDTLSQEKTILGVIVEKESSTKVHRVNENYIKDGGEEMKSIVENKQFEEVKVTKTDVTAKKQKAKDSDGDGLTDDEEIALGTNPYSPDTDGDGVIDSIERGSGTDATNPSDTPDNRQKEQMKHNLVLSEMIKAKDTAALNQHLQEGIKDYFDSDNYKNFLEGMSHFNNYSVRNIQLIKAQLPEASMVASFNEWKKRNGHVNKGEKALYVQAPVTVIKKDADGKPVINADTGEKETFTYFKPVPVFDISQVSPVAGKKLNLPKIGEVIPSQITKEYYQNVYHSLRDISQKENGIPIRFRELGKSYGSYSRKTNEITIKKGMTYEQTLSTLIHEMAHSELHNKKSLTERFEGKLTRSSKELQAESIAYVVSNHLGFDISNYSFAYLASWSKEPDGLENLKAQLEIVQEEASSLMKRIDKHLEKYQNLTVSKDEILTANQKRELSKATNPFYQSLQKAKAEVNNMKKGDEPSNEKTVKKDNRPTKC